MKLDLPPRVRARLDPAERFGLRLTLYGLAVVAVAIPFTTLLLEVLAKGPATRLDSRVANTMNAWVHRHLWAVPILKDISNLAKPPVLAVWVVIAAISMLRTGRRRIAIFLVVTSLGGGIVDSLVKLAVNRSRPVVDHPVATALGKSFPSGHAMSSTVTYGALLVALWPIIAIGWRRRALVATVVLVAMVGTSRLLLGVHFVTDVVGGYVLGLAWLAGSVASFETWKVEERRAAIAEQHRRLPHEETSPLASAREEREVSPASSDRGPGLRSGPGGPGTTGRASA
jgi:undecaprenyl-diphosphatase